MPYFMGACIHISLIANYIAQGIKYAGPAYSSLPGPSTGSPPSSPTILAKGGTGAPVQREDKDGGCNHFIAVRHISIVGKEFINSDHLKTSPTPVPTFALVEFDNWC